MDIIFIFLDAKIQRIFDISKGQVLMFEKTDLVREFNSLIGCPIDSSDEFGEFALAYEIVTKQ